MKRARRLLPLVAALVVLAVMLATTGVAQAGWNWCNDPIVDIGNDDIGYTTTNIEFAVSEAPWDYAPLVNIDTPEGVFVLPVDLQGSTVTSGTDDDLRLFRNSIQTNMTVLVLPRDTSASARNGKVPKIKVRVSANGRILAEAVGKVGQKIVLKVRIPVQGGA